MRKGILGRGKRVGKGTEVWVVCLVGWAGSSGRLGRVVKARQGVGPILKGSRRQFGPQEADDVRSPQQLRLRLTRISVQAELRQEAERMKPKLNQAWVPGALLQGHPEISSGLGHEGREHSGDPQLPGLGRGALP